MFSLPRIVPYDENLEASWDNRPYGRFRLSGKANTSPTRVSQGMTIPDAIELPEGFPINISGDSCWDGRSFGHSATKYTIMFDDNDIENIESALRSFKRLGLKPNMLEPATFPLSTDLGNRLRSVSAILHHGVGFAVLRGLDPKRYSPEDNLIIFAGVVSWIGKQRVTNPLGMSVEHIRNATSDARPEGVVESELEPAKQPHKMNFHADRFMADNLALHVREKSAAGGEQYIASFASIYNELVRTDPEVLRILAKNWTFPHAQGEPQSGPVEGPIIFPAEKRVIAQLVWAPFVAHPSYMTPERERALNAVNELAKRMCVKIECKTGDIQLINNFAMLHARNAFTDSASQRRHIVRIGFRDPELQWKIPEGWELQFNTPYSTPMAEQILPVEDSDPWRSTSTAASHHG